MKYVIVCLIFFTFSMIPVIAQMAELKLVSDTTERNENVADEARKTDPKARIFYGTASYYADKFNGRQTASGELYDSQKMTAACNALPLGSWVKVTNLSNNKVVIVRTNDRLHPKMTRIVDLSRLAAEKLGYIGRGLTKVKVEVLQKK